MFTTAHRRALVVLSLVAGLVLAAPAGASPTTGPGGWEQLGNGGTPGTASLDGAVYAMGEDFGDLLVGGAFLHAGGSSFAHFAIWDGNGWGSLPGVQPLNGDVHAIVVDAAHLRVFIGGNFTNAGGNPNADFLAVWDGNQVGLGWQPFCNSSGPAFTASVAALQIIGSTLYVGGAFSDGAGIPAADKLVACDLNTGAASATVSSSDAINSGVFALTADSNGILYAGGTFINLDGIKEADHVAAYDPATGLWHAMGSGPAPNFGAVPDIVRALSAKGTDVYVGTDAKNVADIPTADNVARWDGSSWSAVGSNTAGTDGWFPTYTSIDALSTFQSLVFATGSFQNADGDPRADEIAYFNGYAWHPIGSDGAGNGPLNSTGLSLFSYHTAIHVGGSFTSAGGDTVAHYVASFPFWRADSRIGTQIGGPFVGNDVYSATGAGEGKKLKVLRGHQGTFYLRLENDGLLKDRLTVKGTGGAKGFTVKYFRLGGADVTSQVKSGSFLTGILVPGSSYPIKMTVKVAATGRRVAAYLVKASSSGSARPDGVVATVTAT